MNPEHRPVQSRIGRLAMMMLSASLVVAASVIANEPDFARDLPRLAPLEPDKALESFQVAKGFRIDLVAAEPLVTDPIAMAFDEDGRLFVIEMRDYSEHPNDHLGRVRMLEDTDGDGRMDRSTIFAEKLSWPTAVICSQGGIFVGAAPHIFFLKDTDGDGKADVNKIVYTGLGRSNVQGLVNSFLYGLDHRIHVAVSSAAGTLTRPDDPTFKPIPLRGRDFAFDPITLAAEPITGGGQHGATFDDFGRRFVCSNSDHIQMVMIEDRYTASSPPGLASPPARMSIAADGPQAEVYRISPVEPWRVLRTKLRVSGAVPGPVEGGGRAAGYFTSATGLTIYRGDAMPDQRGNAFVADVGSNIIHRKKLTPRGIGFIATRIDEKAEFVASTDTWFRPVQMTNGPDGCLWVADMYREVIEHPASLPPAIKKHLDLNSGRDRGRIYRIAPDGFKQRAIPKLSKATTAELVMLLEHENAWHRETAARLIQERKDPTTVNQLRALLRKTKSAVGQLQALHGIGALKQLSRDDILYAMKQTEPEVREHAIQFCESMVKDDKEMMRELFDLLDHPYFRVRFQACQSMSLADSPRRSVSVSLILRRHGDDAYFRWAALRSVGGSLVNAIQALMSTGGNDLFITELIEQLPSSDIIPVLKLINEDELESHPFILLNIASSINRIGDDPALIIRKNVPRLLPGLERSWASAEKTIDDRDQRGQLWAITILQSAPADRAIPRLSVLLKLDAEPTVQRMAAVTLAHYPSDEATRQLLGAVAQSTPSLRELLIELLLGRKERMVALLGAIESMKIPLTALSAPHREVLISAPDENVRARAGKLFAPSADRQAVVDRYLKETAALTGNSAHGKQLFAAQCAACHKLENVGHELGPNLAAFAQRGNEAILTNLLDPNREVNPAYLNHIIELKDGDIVTGIITSESASSITLASGNGVSRTVARSNIDSLRATGKSLMPEGIEATLSPDAAADLLAYLASLKEQKP